jgi:hypothetical protein
MSNSLVVTFVLIFSAVHFPISDCFFPGGICFLLVNFRSSLTWFVVDLYDFLLLGDFYIHANTICLQEAKTVDSLEGANPASLANSLELINYLIQQGMYRNT